MNIHKIFSEDPCTHTKERDVNACKCDEISVRVFKSHTRVCVSKNFGQACTVPYKVNRISKKYGTYDIL